MGENTDRIRNMDINEKAAFLEKLVAAIVNMEDFLTKGPSADTSNTEAVDKAEEHLRKFEEALNRHREEENRALLIENSLLKKKIEDAMDLKETIAGMNRQLEKLRRDYEQALRERDEAREESGKLQAIWAKMHG